MVHPLRSPEEDMLLAMLVGDVSEERVFRKFHAARGAERQRWYRALDTRSFDQLDKIRRRTTLYKTPASRAMGAAVNDVLDMRRAQGRIPSRDRRRRDAAEPVWIVVDTERGDRVLRRHRSRTDARNDAAERNRAARSMRYAYMPEYALESY